MHNHAPEGYICPLCLAAHGIENDSTLTRQSDIFYQDAALIAIIGAFHWTNNHGNVIIFPRAHYENIYDLPDNLGGQVFSLARRIALAMKSIYGCDGTSTRQHNEPAGNQDVWHYHLHVFPRYAGDQLYRSEKIFTEVAERAEFASRLGKAL